nr:hypothetical protein [Tessaracoccus coleopterorum]
MAKRGSYAKGVVRREEILSGALEVIASAGIRGPPSRRSPTPSASASLACCTTSGPRMSCSPRSSASATNSTRSISRRRRRRPRASSA